MLQLVAPEDLRQQTAGHYQATGMARRSEEPYRFFPAHFTRRAKALRVSGECQVRWQVSFTNLLSAEVAVCISKLVP